MPLARNGRAVRVLAWIMHTPRRAATVAILAVAAVLAATLSVIGLAARAGKDPGAPAADRSSCRAVTEGFARSFFTDPAAAGWEDRIAQWVDPSLRDGVASIDPDGVPAGAVTVEKIDEQPGACDAYFTVGAQNMRVRVEASTTAGDGQWYVTAWGTP